MAVYFLAALFCFWVASRVPYTHDDWDWGLGIGMEQFLTASINSRYAGNFLEVVMTRSAFAKTLILGSVYFLLPLAGAQIALGTVDSRREDLRLAAFLLGQLLLWTMNTGIFQQTYGWVAGFANYVVSALPLAVYLLAVLNLWQEGPDKAEASPVKNIALFLLCVVMQLFIENLTVSMAALSVLLCILCRIRRKKWDGRYVWMLLGSAAGAVIMFSSSIYGTLVSTGTAVEGVRELSVSAQQGVLGSVLNIVRQGAVLVAKLWCENHVVCLGILAALTLLLYRNRDKYPAAGKLLTAGNLILAGYLLLTRVLDFGQMEALLGAAVWDLVRVLSGLVFFGLVSAELLLLYRNRPEMLYRLSLSWLTAPLVIVPLVVTTESGDRLFFTVQFLLTVFALQLVCDLLKDVSGKTMKKTLAVMLAAVVILWGGFARIYGAIGSCSARREQIIAQALQTGQTQIVLPAYPYGDYLWFPDPANQQRMEYFKAFYGIPEQVDVVIQ